MLAVDVTQLAERLVLPPQDPVFCHFLDHILSVYCSDKTKKKKRPRLASVVKTFSKNLKMLLHKHDRQTSGALVVAQLAEWSLPIPEVRSSNLVISKIL